jgi:RND family efflux transporter MFP subunit
MIIQSRFASITTLILVLAAGRISAADGPGQFHRPPTKVVAANGEAGVLSPQGEFPGTVFFHEVSDVATEVRGKVLEVLFDEGDAVTAGQVLVRLDDELLRKDLGATQARLDRDRTFLEDAQVRLTRAEELVGGGLTPVEQLDATRFDVQALQFSVAEATAALARLETLLRKSSIVSPFDGIVIDRMTDVGEWKSEGSVIAVIARQNEYEVTIDLPETTVAFAQLGQKVELQISGGRVIGTIDAIIPRGDVATRTFPVKLHIESATPLLEGMTARARMPIGASVECLLLPRDAILNQLGANFVFTVQDGIAHKHSIEVVGYEGMTAGISAPDLGPGQLFIVKGHERLIEGDTVEVVPAIDAAAPTATSDGR